MSRAGRVFVLGLAALALAGCGTAFRVSGDFVLDHPIDGPTTADPAGVLALQPVAVPVAPAPVAPTTEPE